MDMIKTGVIEDELFLGKFEGDIEEISLKYYFSNNLNEIIDIINMRILNRFPNVNTVKWENNTERLAKKVKDKMNYFNVNYSMTISNDKNDINIKHVVINFRSNNEWLFCGGVIISNEYLTYEEVGAC